MEMKIDLTPEHALRHQTDPRFKYTRICTPDLTLSFLRKKRYDLKKPWQIGFTILSLSKAFMESLYYDELIPRLGNLSVMMSDTVCASEENNQLIN